jgi:membrane associated rhomboid family serine protease
VQDSQKPPGNDNVVSFRRKSPDGHEPLINLPPVTKILLLAILAIQLVVSLLDEPSQFWVMEHFGFTPAYYTGDIPFDWPAIAGPLTFSFIHGGWAHTLINAVMLAAFGAGLEPWMGWKRMLILMFCCAIISILVQLGVSIGSTNPVVGASGALSGLFAAAIIMMQERSGMSMPGRFGYWPLILIWVGAAMLFGVIGGPQGETIAWPAHIGGFLAGFILYRPIMKIKV